MERMNGLNQYDFSARWLDNAVTCFTTSDPLAERRTDESPYSYCGGDPVNRMDPSGLDWFVSTNGRNFACLTQSEISSLGSKIKGGCFDGFDVGTCCNVGPTYNFQTSDGTAYICADDCQVYRKDAYDRMKQNQQNGITTPQWMLKDGLASKLKIIGNISLQNRSNFLGPSGITYNISDFEPPTELPIPLTGLNVSEITIEPLPGIDMNVDAIASDATSITTSTPMPNVSYSSEPTAFFSQGGGYSGGGNVGYTLSNTIDNITNVLSMAGTAGSTYAGLRYTSYNGGGGYFRTANGNFYNMSVLELQSNGKFVRGVQGFRNGMMVAEKASAVPRVIGNWVGILTTGYFFYKFRSNPTIGNGIPVGEGIVSLFSWEVGLGLTYIHTSIDYQKVMIQNQLQILNTVDDNNLSGWEKIGILNSTPSNPWGPCP